ncbi:hypothetical protein D3C80_1698720 [compost metagenome]
MQAQQRASERRLPAAALADQAEGLAASDLEGHTVERTDVDRRLAGCPGNRAAPAAIVLHQVFNGNQRRIRNFGHASTSERRMQRARRLSPSSRMSILFRQAARRSLQRE